MRLEALVERPLSGAAAPASPASWGGAYVEDVDSTPTPHRRATDAAQLAVTRRAIDRDLALVRSAIELVATGGAPHVSVGGLAFGEALLPSVAAVAMRRHVHVRVAWSPFDETSSVEVFRDR